MKICIDEEVLLDCDYSEEDLEDVEGQLAKNLTTHEEIKTHDPLISDCYNIR